MATSLTVPSFLAGQALSATDMTQVKTVLEFLVNPPKCRVRSTVAQSIPNTAFTALLFNTEDIDTASYHSTVTNTGRITPTQAGWHRFDAGVLFQLNGAGVRSMAIRKNNDLNHYYGEQQIVPLTTGSSTGLSLSIEIYANGTTDYFEAIVLQTSGGALNTQAAEVGVPGSNNYFSASWVRSSQT